MLKKVNSAAPRGQAEFTDAVVWCVTAKAAGEPSGSSLLHGRLVAGDGLGRVHTPTVAVHALKIGVAQRSEGRYPPGGVEGQELLRGKKRSVCLSTRDALGSEDLQQREPVPTMRRARPCSSMSGTKSSIGLGGRGVKALCGRATSWGQSSAEGTPTTLWDDNLHR